MSFLKFNSILTSLSVVLGEAIYPIMVLTTTSFGVVWRSIPLSLQKNQILRTIFNMDLLSPNIVTTFFLDSGSSGSSVHSAVPSFRYLNVCVIF